MIITGFKAWVAGELVDMSINDDAIGWVRRHPVGKTEIAISGKEADTILVEGEYEAVLKMLIGEDPYA